MGDLRYVAAPAGLLTPDANHDGRGTRTVDGIVRNQNGGTTE